MKTLEKFLFILVLVVAFTACKNEQQPEIKTVASEDIQQKTELDPNATYAKAEFTIEGMTCAMGCAATIEKNLAKLEGVRSAEVDFERELAMVEYDEAKQDFASLEASVKKTGETYSVKDIKNVEAFGEKSACPPDCDKKCCADKSEAEKKACSEDCTKACCATKA